MVVARSRLPRDTGLARCNRRSCRLDLDCLSMNDCVNDGSGGGWGASYLCSVNLPYVSF